MAETNLTPGFGAVPNQPKIPPTHSGISPHAEPVRSVEISPEANAIAMAATAAKMLEGSLDELVHAVQKNGYRLRTGSGISEAPPITLLIESDGDVDTLAEFLSQLSNIYSELSNGDELVILEGRVPAEAELPV